MAPDIVKQQDARKQEQHRAWQRNHLRNYKKESERAKTFNNWSVSFMDSEKLVKSGFYYTNKRDEVKCAYCGVRIDQWVEGDDPEEEHRKLSGNCPLVRGENPGENGGAVQSETEDNEEEEVESEDVCGTYEYRPFSAPERPGKTPYYIEPVSLLTSFEQLGVSKMSGPVAPDYATYSARIKTFSNWRIGEIQPPEKIAEAGFYYMGVQDNVLCFHCGGGLKNWEAEDDPWVEHARWFSKCGFVILRKGREFVMDILFKEKRLLAGLNTKEPSNGCGSNVATASSSSSSSCQPAKEESKEKDATNNSTSSVAPSSSLPVESQPSLSSNVEGKEIELCRICYMRERGIVFLPCGHFISCTECAPSLSSCAVCRKPFEATVRAYLS